MHQEPATPYKNKDPKSEENICNMPFSLKNTPQIDRQIHTPETTNSVDHVGWVDIHTSDPKVVRTFFMLLLWASSLKSSGIQKERCSAHYILKVNNVLHGN
jgi:hypothetical protein